MTRWVGGVALAFLWPLVAGCGSSARASERPLVFAAASLSGAFEALAEEFERVHGVGVDLHFAGTPTLVFQLREGAPADVFASADAWNMRRAVESGRVASEPVVFAGNRLAIVTRAGNPERIGGLADLARPELSVGLCGPEVPAGRYAREALARAGESVTSVSDEPSVKAVVAKVSLGELDAGVVFLTDARSAPGEVDCVPLGAACDVRAEYSIARIEGAGARAGAFLDFVLSEDGRELFERHGFAVP